MLNTGMPVMNAPASSPVVSPGRYYQPQGSEVDLFLHASQNRLPVLIKGPTGCGKTRFVEHMAERLQRPLYTVACHDDLTAADLIGRFLIGKDGTFWQDGPLTRAVREGAICYLDAAVISERVNHHRGVFARFNHLIQITDGTFASCR